VSALVADGLKSSRDAGGLIESEVHADTSEEREQRNQRSGADVEDDASIDRCRPFGHQTGERGETGEKNCLLASVRDRAWASEISNTMIDSFR
jgi:hypothetical protein